MVICQTQQEELCSPAIQPNNLLNILRFVLRYLFEIYTYLLVYAATALFGGKRQVCHRYT